MQRNSGSRALRCNLFVNAFAESLQVLKTCKVALAVQQKVFPLQSRLRLNVATTKPLPNPSEKSERVLLENERRASCIKYPYCFLSLLGRDAEGREGLFNQNILYNLLSMHTRVFDEPFVGIHTAANYAS